MDMGLNGMAGNSPSQRPVWQGGAPREDGGARGVWLPSSVQVSAQRTSRHLAGLERPPAGSLTPRPPYLVPGMPRARKGNAPRKGSQRRGGEWGAPDSCSAVSRGPAWVPVVSPRVLGRGTLHD